MEGGSWPYEPFTQWPTGIRAAVCMTWDVDDETPVYSRPGAYAQDASEIEQRRYGVRRGIPLIVKMLQDTGVPATFFIPSYMARQWPQLVRELSQMGYEIGGHGYLHEPVGALERQREADIIAEALRVLRGLSHTPVWGYRTPSWQFNLWTPELLTNAQILYDSSLMGDISPYAIDSGGSKHLIEIPIHWYTDDVEYWGHTKNTRDHTIVAPSNVLEIWKGELDGIVEAGGCSVLTLHPHVSGRPGLVNAIQEFIKYAKTIKGLWFSTPGEIARYAHDVGHLPTIQLAPPSPVRQYMES